MTAPDPGLDTLERHARRRYSRLMPYAWATLVWERLWPRLWRGVAFLGVFIALALFDILPLLPFWMHWAVLAGFSLLLIWLLYVDLRSFCPPARREVLSRIEQDSRVRHHPLAVLDDDDISGTDDPATVSLWREHKRRAAISSVKLRVDIPSPGLARFDPYGFRAMVLLLVVISVTAGSGDAAARLERALLPEMSDFRIDTRVDIWITPPNYTGFQPFHISLNHEQLELPDSVDGSESGAEEVRTIPVGSTLLAQVGSSEKPVLSLPNRQLDFESILPGNEMGNTAGEGYRLQTTIGAADVVEGVGTLSVRSDDGDIIAWPVRITDDAPPRIEFTQPPSNAGYGRLTVTFAAEDDFGLTTAALVIRNPEISADSAYGDTVRLNLPLNLSSSRAVAPRSSNRATPSKLMAETLSIETSVIRDLSEHDWAGLPVQLRLEATDAQRQIGRSDSFPMVLPERIFNHPVARALSEFRKRLVTPSDDDIIDVIAGLDDVSSRPEHFHHDQVVFMTMRVSRARLVHDNSTGDARDRALKSIRKMLWKTALRIEDGEFALAGRELAEVQEALEAALSEGDFTEAVEELLNSLDQALDRFLAALDDQLNEKGMESLSDIPGLSYMDESDLKQMIKDARELAQTGSVDAAEATLDELRDLLNAIQSAMQSDQPMDQFAAIRKMMQSLAGISQDQQGLLDETFREMRKARGGYGEGDVTEEVLSDDPSSGAPLPGQGSGGQVPSVKPGVGETSRENAALQEAIRRQLGDLMIDLSQMIGTLPESMLDAKDAMGRAVGSLRAIDPAGAVDHQSKALESLRQATEQVGEQISRQLRALPGNMPAQSGSTLSTGSSDPFGRMEGGAIGAQMDNGTVKVPNQMEMRRVREIYEELRRRAGNLKRPVVEREYIHRLLRQF